MLQTVEMIPGNIPLEVVRKAIKNIYIRVYPPDGRVVVSAPRRMSERQITEFINSKRNWIIKQHTRLNNPEQAREKEFINGEYHFYEGRKHILKLVKGTKGISVRLYEGSIIMNLDGDYNRETRKKILEAWYRHAIKTKVEGFRETWEEKMGLGVSEVRIRKMKTKWGTCNVRDRRIWLNLDLARYPDSILEYIFVHEMVHLLERSHNKRFYSLMDKYLPDWKERKKVMGSVPA